MVRQSRAGSYETCILTTCHSLKGVTFDLVIPVGLFSVTARTALCVFSPYCPLTLALNPVGFGEGSSTSRLLTRFGTLSAGLHTLVISANSSMPA